MKSIIINSLLFIFCINLTIAQVNTEAMRGEKVNDGILNKLVVEFGFEKSKKEVLDAAAKYRADYFHSSGLHSFLILDFENGYEKKPDNDRNQIVKKGFGHLRITKNIASDIFIEIFSQIGFNDFLAMKDRKLAGTGFRYKMLAGDNINSFVGIGVMQEKEIYDLEDEPNKNLLRSTNYINWKIKITEAAILNSTAYYQFATSQLNDFRLLYDGMLEFKLGKDFSFTVELNYRYDNDPHGYLGKSYFEINNGIQFNF